MPSATNGLMRVMLYDLQLMPPAACYNKTQEGTVGGSVLVLPAQNTVATNTTSIRTKNA
jgi:hypothetical protein